MDWSWFEVLAMPTSDAAMPDMWWGLEEGSGREWAAEEGPRKVDGLFGMAGVSEVDNRKLTRAVQGEEDGIVLYWNIEQC
jgi:hypothetical protein